LRFQFDKVKILARVVQMRRLCLILSQQDPS
jgi:hypothetical protein